MKLAAKTKASEEPGRPEPLFSIGEMAWRTPIWKPAKHPAYLRPVPDSEEQNP